VGIELDPQLADQARRNLRHWTNVTVVDGDGSQFVSDPFDAILVNAGATEPLLRWVDQLRIRGRLLVPMTVDLPIPELGAGHMLLVTRHSGACSARFTSPVGIFHCAGARTPDGVDLLRQAYLRGGHERVRSLRRADHPGGPQCWLHAPRFCLSYLAADTR
jgi:protein-L-isoaspartate(D-aspartate) O-methyltransferase